MAATGESDEAGATGATGATGDQPPAAATERLVWERLYAVATRFVAPASVFSAILFYFGYVSSRAQYRYFGLDVDTIGLSTRDFVVRSPQPLLVPLLLVPAAAAGLLVLSRALDRRLGPEHLRAVGVAALALVSAGVALVLAFTWIGDWPYYPMVTPLVLAAGLLAMVWCWRRQGDRAASVVLALVGVAVCVFWATATLAQWTGLGSAHRTARNLGQLPAVVMDVEEQLRLGTTPDAGVSETRIGDEDATYRYRYRGLRLLIQSGDRMFLVPERWTPSNSTLMVDMNDVRLRFRFVDDPPD